VILQKQIVATKPTEGAEKVKIGDFGYIYVKIIGAESKEFKLLRENRPKNTR